VPFYEGELLARCADLTQRGARLAAARVALLRFVRHCAQLEATPTPSTSFVLCKIDACVECYAGPLTNGSSV
jgi:hypothetical protein